MNKINCFYLVVLIKFIVKRVRLYTFSFFTEKRKNAEFGKHFYLFFVIICLIMGDEFRNDFYWGYNRKN